MRYTIAMTELLNSLDLNCQVLFGHYLDKYFTDLEEPEFKSFELSKIWYLLLVDGLLEEIRMRGTYQRLAFVQLKKLVDYNSACYTNPNTKYRTIKSILKTRVRKDTYREEHK